MKWHLLLFLLLAGADVLAQSSLLLSDIRPGIDSSNPASLTNVNGTLFFTAKDNVNGFELWKSDGTVVGTVMVEDANPAFFNTAPNNLTNINGVLYYAGTDSITRFELWKSDGTEAGTGMIKDINPEGSSSPGNLTAVNEIVFLLPAPQMKE